MPPTVPPYGSYPHPSVRCDFEADGYRLPTEAEWEYAARGGKYSEGYEYAGSNTVGDVGWYGGNSGNQTHPVGQKKPNELGIHDMSGNVFEWCWDWKGDYPSESQTDPVGPLSGEPGHQSRVMRGGSWHLDGHFLFHLRVKGRYGNDPKTAFNVAGFRLARNVTK